MKELKPVKNELQNIINGNDGEGQVSLIKAAQIYLKTGSFASAKVETKQFTRAEEERALIEFANANNLWLNESGIENYLSEGAEQKIYFPENTSYVIKSADGIFYTSWIDYFNNLLLHNYFFTNTGYELIGFHQKGKKLFVVIKQPYIISTEATNLENVHEFLIVNGFKHKKNNDFYHPDLGIILEDLHDENVLTNSGVLFFVDTVFYLTEGFYK